MNIYFLWLCYLAVYNLYTASQGELLGQMDPFSSNSFNCTFNSASSIGAILYGAWEIGAVLGMTSIVSSISCL